MNETQWAQTFFSGLDLEDGFVGYLLWNETAHPFSDLAETAVKLRQIAEGIRNHMLIHGGK